jgi:hypothetical protein
VTSHHALPPASPNPGKCPRSFAHSPHFSSCLAGFPAARLSPLQQRQQMIRAEIAIEFMQLYGVPLSGVSDHRHPLPVADVERLAGTYSGASCGWTTGRVTRNAAAREVTLRRASSWANVNKYGRFGAQNVSVPLLLFLSRLS